MHTSNPPIQWGNENKVLPAGGKYREMEKFYRKESAKMKLIWKELLHANFRCGRMCADRAGTLAVYGTLPLAAPRCMRR